MEAFIRTNESETPVWARSSSNNSQLYYGVACTICLFFLGLMERVLIALLTRQLLYTGDPVHGRLHMKHSRVLFEVTDFHKHPRQVAKLPLCP